MNILILEHNKERERLIYQLIEDRITKLSPESNVQIHSFDDGLEVAEYFRPDVILSHPVRDEQGACVMMALKLLYHCNVVCLTTEGVENFDIPEIIESRLGPFDFGDKLVDYFFYWGEKPRDVFCRALLRRGLVSSEDRVGISGYVNYEEGIIDRHLEGDPLYKEIKEFSKKFRHNYCFVTAEFYDPDPIKEAIESSELNDNMPKEEYEQIKQDLIEGNNYRYE